LSMASISSRIKVFVKSLYMKKLKAEFRIKKKLKSNENRNETVSNCKLSNIDKLKKTKEYEDYPASIHKNSTRITHTNSA
jgi:hypothetical protein